jgi:hypothetical protein
MMSPFWVMEVGVFQFVLSLSSSFTVPFSQSTACRAEWRPTD